MLKNIFYHILDQSEEKGIAPGAWKYHFSVKLNADHPVYTGHFPGQPVVPGVCQIGMVRELASAVTGKNLRLVAADNIKFLAMIQPEVNGILGVELSIGEKEGDACDVSAVISATDKIFLKFRGNFITEKEA